MPINLANISVTKLNYKPSGWIPIFAATTQDTHSMAIMGLFNAGHPILSGAKLSTQWIGDRRSTAANLSCGYRWWDLAGSGRWREHVIWGNKNHAKVDWNAWQLKKNENLSSIDIYHLPITLEASHMIKTIKID